MREKLVFMSIACAVACASQPTTTDAPVAAATESVIERTAAPTTPTVLYHQFEGEPRAYVPLEAGACQRNEQAQVLFEPRAIWKFDARRDEWTSVTDVAGQVRIACNAMIAVEDVLGQNLDLGTFAIIADVDGAPEHGVFYNGEVLCSDVDLGQPPDGEVVLCVSEGGSAEARLVPDPAMLSVD